MKTRYQEKVAMEMCKQLFFYFSKYRYVGYDIVE